MLNRVTPLRVLRVSPYKGSAEWEEGGWSVGRPPVGGGGLLLLLPAQI